MGIRVRKSAAPNPSVTALKGCLALQPTVVASATAPHDQQPQRRQPGEERVGRWLGNGGHCAIDDDIVEIKRFVTCRCDGSNLECDGPGHPLKLTSGKADRLIIEFSITCGSGPSADTRHGSICLDVTSGEICSHGKSSGSAGTTSCHIKGKRSEIQLESRIGRDAELKIFIRGPESIV